MPSADSTCVLCGGNDVRHVNGLTRCRTCGYVLARRLGKGDALGEWVASVEQRAGDSTTTWILQRLPQGLHAQGEIAVLDVGCWTGQLLASMPSSWRRHGIEPSYVARDVARDRGVEVIGDFVEATPLERGIYNLVTMIDVVEHVPDPAALFVRVADALKPGGWLLVLTGDSGSWAARLWRSNWYYLRYVEHVGAISRLTASRLAEMSGLHLLHATRVAHPATGTCRDLRGAARHVKSRRKDGPSPQVSLVPLAGANLLTLSRLTRRRDHILLTFRRPEANL